MTRGDRLLIASLALALVVAWPVGAAIASQGERHVRIEGPGGASDLSLDQDGDHLIEGLAGGLTVRVHGGAVSVIDTACPDRICIRTGAVQAAGSVIACVPNGVIVSVEGRPDDVLDAFSR